MNKPIETVDEVIAAIGRERVMALTGKKTNNLSNWSAAGFFPPTTYLVLTNELTRLRRRASSRLWRMIEGPKRAA